MGKQINSSDKHGDVLRLFSDSTTSKDAADEHEFTRIHLRIHLNSLSCPAAARGCSQAHPKGPTLGFLFGKLPAPQLPPGPHSTPPVPSVLPVPPTVPSAPRCRRAPCGGAAVAVAAMAERRSAAGEALGRVSEWADGHLGLLRVTAPGQGPGQGQGQGQGPAPR